MPGAIPHSVLPTVLDHCTPAIGGEDDDFHDPLCMYTSLLVSIKGGGGLSLKGVGPFDRTQRSALLTEHIRSSGPRY